MAVAALVLSVATSAAAVLPACEGANRPGRGGTCIYDGDTGWQDGRKWRLKNVDAPELSGRVAACRAEQIMAIRARDRLRLWLARGFTILPTGQNDSDGTALVAIELADGRDAGMQLLSENLVQALPNTGNPWCAPR